jgi:hypothetical protein
MKKIIPIFFFALLFYSCSNKPKFNGVWLGTAREMDKEVYIPMPRLMIVNSDGSFNNFLIDKPDSNWTTWEIKNSSLRIDTTKFISSRFEITESQFIFTGPFKAYYERLPDKKTKINLANFENSILKSSWESDYDKVHFYGNGTIILFNKKDSTTSTLCWNTNTAEGFSFLIKKGNHIDCERFYRFPELITSFSENQFIVKRWENDAWKEVIYSKIDEKQNAPDSFQVCNPFLYRNNPQHRYYYKGTFYKGGFYKINKLFNSFYKAPINSNENGLIKVEFIVNCQGKPGRFSMMQFNEDYELKNFSAEISEQLLGFTKTLIDWNAGKNKDGQSIDTFRFLTFKIKNGEVVEIFP